MPPSAPCPKPGRARPEPGRTKQDSGPDRVQQPFDAVIVGAGSAGCALAARLAEDPRRRILLIEAGARDTHPAIHIPAGIVRLIGNPRFDWAHIAEPDPSRGGRIDLWPAGKVLGGSSSINGMLFVRGAAADFDGWAAAGNPGWSHADLLPLFRRMERTGFGTDGQRGRNGPVHVEPLRTRHPIGMAIEQACAEAGLPLNPDYNGAEQDGAGAPQVSQHRGRRWSAARAYLARRPRNLELWTHARVRRILLEGRRATGLLVQHRGAERTLSAREIILAAGTLGSPKLLMLSGIGPAAELQAHGVPVRLAQPMVGRNLAEHPMASLSWTVRGRTYNQLIHSPRLPLLLLDWLVRGRGAATSPYPHAVAFLRSGPAASHPDIQLMMGPFAFDVSSAGVQPFRGPAITVIAALNYPRGRGSLHLRSADPDAPPVIRHALLGHPDDVARLTAAARRVRAIMAMPALASHVVAERLPGPHCQSDADWEAHLRATTILGNHPIGTCAMGPEGVVDHRLRVRGIAGLRIADASIMPAPISGNTNAASIMIGEKTADLVRADWADQGA